MTKKSLNIFTVVFIVGILALSAWKDSLLVFLVLPFLIRPILRESNLVNDVDERDRVIEYKASHISLLTTISFVVVFFVYNLVFKGKNPEQEWYLVLFIPIIVKWMFHVGHIKGSRKLGLAIGFVFGVIWLLFAILSNGISIAGLMQSVFALSILLPTVISLKWAKIGGPILMLIGMAMAVFFTKAWATNLNSVFHVLLMELILPFPVFFSGLLLLVSSFEQEEDEFRDLREGSKSKSTEYE